MTALVRRRGYRPSAKCKEAPAATPLTRSSAGGEPVRSLGKNSAGVQAHSAGFHGRLRLPVRSSRRCASWTRLTSGTSKNRPLRGRRSATSSVCRPNAFSRSRRSFRRGCMGHESARIATLFTSAESPYPTRWPHRADSNSCNAGVEESTTSSGKSFASVKRFTIKAPRMPGFAVF